MSTDQEVLPASFRTRRRQHHLMQCICTCQDPTRLSSVSSANCRSRLWSPSYHPRCTRHTSRSRSWNLRRIGTKCMLSACLGRTWLARWTSPDRGRWEWCLPALQWTPFALRLQHGNTHAQRLQYQQRFKLQTEFSCCYSCCYAIGIGKQVYLKILTSHKIRFTSFIILRQRECWK